MEKYQNRAERQPNGRRRDSPEALIPLPEGRELPIETAREAIGVPCKWCRSTRTKVIRTYPERIRIRFCIACSRKFQTREASI